MKIIDADGHIVESADQLREYLELAYRDTAFDVVAVMTSGRVRWAR